MRKICLFLSCLLTMPAMALDDACTKPSEFTVDRRCYVTDEQKQQKPFNATVALIENGVPYCSGTIVKGHKGDPDTIYVYTAKHCVDSDEDGKPDAHVQVRLQNGDEYTVDLAGAGEQHSTSSEGYIEDNSGDWVLYKIQNPAADIPYVVPGKWDFISADARIIGYGSLKIMSDAEIREFKNKYREFLKTDPRYSNKRHVVTEYVRLYDTKTMDFVEGLMNQQHTNYVLDLFADSNLKVTTCEYYNSNGIGVKCQNWEGNSGGGVFDVLGNLVGIYVAGSMYIGGLVHAGDYPFGLQPVFEVNRAREIIPISSVEKFGR